MLLHCTRTALVVLVALAGASPEALAGRLGPEFRVNTFTRDTQNLPSVAGLSDGGFVVTWTSEQQVGPHSADIYGQRYTHEGKRIGGEFRVNTYNRGVQWSSVAGLRPDEGGFVVTWTSFRQDGYGHGVYGQRYNAAGGKIGGEFRINTHTAHNQEDSSVAKLSNGGFVVTWQSFEQDGDWFGVYGQRFNAEGKRVGSEFRVNTYTGRDQFAPSVAGLSSNGGFVVTWSDAGRHSAYGQVYSAAGVKVGSEFRVRSGRTSVAGLRDGGFVVTTGGDDGSLGGIFGQLYNAAGGASAASSG